MDDLKTALTALAERGDPAGADAVIGRAIAATVTTTAKRQPQPRRRLRFTIAAAVAAAATAAVAAVVVWAMLPPLTHVDRLTVAGLAGAPGRGETTNVLVVGSDSRANLDEDDQRAFGSPDEVAGARADTILVVQVQPGTQRITLRPIPRDLWIGTRRISSAFDPESGGGASELVARVRDVVGVDIHHYVVVDFSGFRSIIDAVGGVPIHFDAPTRDRVTGLDITEPGCTVLDGSQALAFARSRRYEQRDPSDRWVADPTGDLGRIERQETVLAALATRLLEQGDDLRSLERLIRIAASHVVVDSELSTARMIDLARTMRALGPGSVETQRLPVTPATVGGAAVLRLDDQQPDAQATAPRPPAATACDATNGTTPAGRRSLARTQPSVVRAQAAALSRAAAACYGRRNTCAAPPLARSEGGVTSVAS